MRNQVGALAVFAGLLLAPGASAAEVSGPDYLNELGSGLLPLRSGDHDAIVEARNGDFEVHAQEVLVDVYVSGDPEAASRRLSDLGMDVAATGTEPVPVVEGWLPVDQLVPSARLGITDAILPVVGGGVDVGAQTSAGVAKHNIPQAIAVSGTNGAGVDVGVISDSINQVGGGVAGSQATGDLPASVVVLQDDPGSSDEGRAMSEIIFDEAPGINRLLFSSGTATGAVGKAASIDALVANGADVIADDIFYLGEPMFQDGQVALAVDRAKAAGVAYFASAGNRARQSYEGTFSSNGATPDLHDFGEGDTINGFTTNVPGTSASLPSGGSMTIALQWDEPWGRAATNLNVALVNPTTGAALAPATVGGTTDNIATGIPSESVTYRNTTGVSVPVGVRITRVTGSRAPFMKWIEQDNYSPNPVPQIDTQSNTINPDAASARGSMSVAAVAAGDTESDTPETYSSRGPNTRLFDSAGNRLASPETRLNPDLAAADAVNTTVPGFMPFGGTSAATPSAAGIAALLRARNPGATVNEIYAQMSDPLNSIQCTPLAAAPDPNCGGGFILADRAISALDLTGPLVTASPAGKKGKGGWFTDDVVVTWNPTDPESPLESNNCPPPFNVTTDGTQTFSCSAVSGGGPAAGTVTIKRDTKPPSKPKIKGIKKGRTYKASQLPKKVKCKAKDKTSGLDKCKVKGYKTSPGKHKLKAVAKDEAGLKSTAKLAYKVK